MEWLLGKIKSYFYTRAQIKKVRLYLKEEMDKVKSMPMEDPPTLNEAVLMYCQVHTKGCVVYKGITKQDK